MGRVFRLDEIVEARRCMEDRGARVDNGPAVSAVTAFGTTRFCEVLNTALPCGL